MKLRFNWSHGFAAASGIVNGIWMQIFLEHRIGSLNTWLSVLSLIISFGFCMAWAQDTRYDNPKTRVLRLLFLFLISSIFSVLSYIVF